MSKIERKSILSLEEYARARNEFRIKVMEHKKNRTVPIGDSVTMIFEDELTVRYQVQEMLRAERIFEEAGIQDELAVYGPLVPDGRNFKATMMIEYTDPEERQANLAKLIGIEDRTWVQVDGHPRVWAIADEDLDRDTDEKTSAVHFLRFELNDQMAEALKRGADLRMGIDHPQYCASVDTANNVRSALAADLA